MRNIGAVLWRFTLWRWFVICAVRFSPRPVSTWFAFRASPLMFELRDLALRDGDLVQASKITAALQAEGEL